MERKVGVPIDGTTLAFTCSFPDKPDSSSLNSEAKPASHVGKDEDGDCNDRNNCDDAYVSHVQTLLKT